MSGIATVGIKNYHSCDTELLILVIHFLYQ